EAERRVHLVVQRGGAGHELQDLLAADRRRRAASGRGRNGGDAGRHRDGARRRGRRRGGPEHRKGAPSAPIQGGGRAGCDRGPPLSELPLVARARGHGDRPAIIAGVGTFTYRDLLDASARVAACLLAGRDDLAEARVAFLAPPGFHYVAIQWGIWRAGGIAIPLAVSHPPAELEYVIRD